MSVFGNQTPGALGQAAIQTPLNPHGAILGGPTVLKPEFGKVMRDVRTPLGSVLVEQVENGFAITYLGHTTTAYVTQSIDEIGDLIKLALVNAKIDSSK